MLTRSALTIRLHPDDDVVIARSQLVGGTTLMDENVTVAGLVPPGHKVATRAVAKGAPVKRYNQIIGFASRARSEQSEGAIRRAASRGRSSRTENTHRGIGYSSRALLKIVEPSS